MVIGIEAERANNPVKTGVEHYAKQLILHLAKLDQTNQYILYLRTKPEAWFFDLPKNFIVKVIPFPIFWTQLRISWEMLVHPVDILFIPASTLPIIHPRKSLITIHDLGWKYYPETFTWWMRTFLKVFTWFAVQSAWQVIAISAHTKKDIVDHYGISSEKVAVVHHGYEQTQGFDLSYISPEVSAKLPEKYLMFLSTIQPRKNLPGLIAAFVQLKREHPELPHKLVVAGRLGWKCEASLAAMEAHKDIVVYLSHVSDSDRWSILTRADALVLPSFYEGFGMWALEAFEAGVPFLTSRISSLPEVAGDAALYFDPHKTDQIAHAMKEVLTNAPLAQQLVVQGKERLQAFSWEKCARETLAVLTKAW
jgi:glycosyltransferase involved in cell wall biosynthesis